MINYIDEEAIQILDGPIRKFAGTSGSISHLCGRPARDNTNWWTGEGPCDYFCYGPYVVLDPGRYNFWWHISGP